MVKYLIIFATIMLIFPVNGGAIPDDSSVPDINNTNISVNIKYLGYDKNFAVEKFRVNMTIDRIGRLTYVEHYYSTGGEGPKFYMSKIHYDANLTDTKISFNISRPKTRLGNPYSSIKNIIVLDGKIIAEEWLDNIKSTQFEIGNVSKSPTITVASTPPKKNDTITTIDTKINTSNTENIINDTNVPESKTGTAIIFEIIAIMLIGLILVVMYQIKKDGEG